MTNHDDDLDLSMADHVRWAMNERGKQTAVSPDAQDRIRETAAGRATRAGLFQRPGALMAMAAALLLLAGVAAFATLRDGNDSPTVVASDDLADDEQEPAYPVTDEVDPDPQDPKPSDEEPAEPDEPTVTVPVPDDVPDALGPVNAVQAAEDGLVIWPLDSRSFSSPDALAWSYATQALGIDSPILGESFGDDCADCSSSVELISVGEDGEPFASFTTLVTYPVDENNWVVVEVASVEVSIISATIAPVGGVRVVGEGRSFEGAGEIVVRSICDPEGLATPTALGGGEMGSVDVIVPFRPCDAPLVIELRTVDTATDFGIPAVAARAIENNPLVGWHVVRVPSDDVLNVREASGTDNPVMSTLAWNATNLVLTGQFDTVSGARWAQIALSDGRFGWVHMGFITAQPADLDDGLIRELAVNLITDSRAPSADLFSDRGVLVGGIGIYADAYTPFVWLDKDEIVDDAVVEWNPFPDDDPDFCTTDGADCDLSTSDFLDIPIERGGVTTEISRVAQVSEAGQFLNGPIAELERFDAAISVSVDVPPSGEGEVDWRTYHVWFDWETGEPQVIGIWRWGWTP